MSSRDTTRRRRLPTAQRISLVLATKYGTFIPALSEHHAGGTNVGRTVINGARLGGEGTRAQYLLGSRFALDLREMSSRRYREVVRTYGPRSYRYAEMIFGNAQTVPKPHGERRAAGDLRDESIALDFPRRGHSPYRTFS